MNSRHIVFTILAVAACLIAVIIRPDIIAAVIALVFVGIVPGTTLTIPSWVTLSIMLVLLIMAIRWVFDEPVYRPQATNKDLARRATARRKVIRHTSTARRTAARKAVRVKA